MVTEENRWYERSHAHCYLEDRAHRVPHRTEAEAVLCELLPARVERVLDLGAGDGHTLALVLAERPDAEGVAVDVNDLMLERARTRFSGCDRIDVRRHDLSAPLPSLGSFDVVVSSFAIHHLPHARKRALYAEAAALLRPGGLLANLEHVSSPTERLHQQFLRAMGTDPADDDPSNVLLDADTQLRWLREVGLVDVDVFWKWRELALLAGRSPG